MVLDAELEKDYNYCWNLARCKAGNFYNAFIFLPKKKRRAIFALYAFCHLGDRIADENVSGESADLAADLSQMRANLEQCYAGEKVQAPIFKALQHSIRQFNLPREPFRQLLDGIESDIKFKGFGTFAELRTYCYQVASTVGLLCVEIFGYKSSSVLKYAENLSIALQLTNIMRDIKEDFLRGRVYLPREDLERFDYGKKDFENERFNGNFQRLMEFQYQRAKSFYKAANNSLPSQERKNQIASEIMKSIYCKILETIKQRQFRIYDGRISLNRFTKAYIALSTCLKIKLGLRVR